MYEVLNNLDNASIEDISSVLDTFNKGGFNEPLIGARMNARYHELTGQDHPVYKEQISIVINNLLADQDELINSGAYDAMYFAKIEQLKASLDGTVKSMEYAEGHHPIMDFQKVLDHLDTASAEEISQQLDLYNGEPIIVNGTYYHPFNEPLTAARLNARYHELTGQDHPLYRERVTKAIEQLETDKDMLMSSGARDAMYYAKIEQLKASLDGTVKSMEYAEGHHPIMDFQKVLDHLDTASAEEISQQLDLYNGEPIIVNGTYYHPFNEPLTAARLNARYRELTGQDHPLYRERVTSAIERLEQDKDILLESGAYDESYFEQLEIIKSEPQATVEPVVEDTTVETFLEERDNQRQLDAEVRLQQIAEMQENLQQAQQITETQDNIQQAQQIAEIQENNQQLQQPVIEEEIMGEMTI